MAEAQFSIPDPIQEEEIIAAPKVTQEKPAPVALGQKVAFSVGSISDQLITNGIGTLAMPIYNLGLGVDPRLLGWALALPRIFDAVIDPSIGNISDNTRSRWGRRRPYVFVGGIIMAIFFILMWMPPTSLIGKGFVLNLPSYLGGTTTIPHLATFFTITSILCYFGYAIFAVPRGGMGIELSTDYHERTGIFAMSTFFAYSAAFLMPWLYNFSIKTGKYFGGNEVLGIRYVGAAVGIIILVCAVIPAIFVRERKEGLEKQPQIPLLKSFAMTFTSYPFWLLFFIVFLILLACSLVGPMNLYISIDYICHGDKKYASYIGGWGGMIQGGVGIIMAPAVAWIARRIGKKTTMIVGEIIAILGFAGSWWLFTPTHPWWQIWIGIIITVGLSCVWVLSGSVMADICDTDQLKYGLRREGIFGAIYGFLIKTSTSCVTIVAGYALVWAGYQTSTGTVQTPQTLLNMRILYLIITVACVGLTLLMTILFPITEKSAREVRAILDARKREAM